MCKDARSQVQIVECTVQDSVFLSSLVAYSCHVHDFMLCKTRHSGTDRKSACRLRRDSSKILIVFHPFLQADGSAPGVWHTRGAAGMADSRRGSKSSRGQPVSHWKAGTSNGSPSSCTCL